MNRQFHQFFRSVILFGFFLFLLKIILSGDIQKFIAPRMMPYMYFTLAVLAILAIIQYFKSGFEEDDDSCSCGHDHDYSASRLKSTGIYLLFIIPIMTGMMFSDHILGSSAAANKGFKYEMRSAATKENIDEQTAPGDDEAQPGNNVILENPGVLTPKDLYPELYEDMQENDKLVLHKDNYIGTISLLEDGMDDYVGKEVVTHGFVFRENDFPSDQMVVGRFGISCCVADGGVYGMLVESEDLNQYKNDTWVEVRGVLEKVEFNGWELPLIIPTEIKPIEAPDEPYVYEKLEYTG
ncbi:TIGR03943 family protein [Halobacillus litoralis]|uniref:TIGR03943 family putative permease subunit n=1 Tax=Halobacillus litoralis TaxID=45668 RepID=UPI001CD5E72D|nr:TIGR03943 family protein [Halobacillus litoralis]MCA0970564.1 TIGR03943 family protein [Halobacillus litoralis]